MSTKTIEDIKWGGRLPLQEGYWARQVHAVTRRQMFNSWVEDKVAPRAPYPLKAATVLTTVERFHHGFQVSGVASPE